MEGIIHTDSDTELMAQCYEYIHMIELLESTEDLTGLYFADVGRIQIHDLILELTGLSREDLQEVTNNISEYPDARDLYVKIVDIREQKRKEGKLRWQTI